MMNLRRLGRSLTVSAIGLGCMGLSEFYLHERRAVADPEATLRRAVERGVTLFDTADIYGRGANEELLGRVFATLPGAVRDRLVIATKFGTLRHPDGRLRGVCGRPDYVREACEASLKRLGVKVIDLFFQHRVDPNVPIEETVGAMAELVREGKVRHLGLCEASAETVRRAHAAHRITAVQSEYSLLTRDAESDLLPTLRQLGIGFVPYAPLGRGLLAGVFTEPETLPVGDIRRSIPRFQGENFARNLTLVTILGEMAAGMRCTPAQLALAFVLSQGSDVVPIPGTCCPAHLDENLDALNLPLAADELARLGRAMPLGSARGNRYPTAQMAFLNG